MRITEYVLMSELHLSKSDIDNMTPKMVNEYMAIIHEVKKMEKEKSEAARNG